MSLLQFVASSAVLLGVVGLAFAANRRLGFHLEREAPPPTRQEQAWLDELAVLQLEERHPVC